MRADTAVNPFGPELKEEPVQKTLFALLVAVVSIVGWQVIQKYKVEGLDVLASVRQRVGWNTSTTTYPPANPQQHPGLNGGYTYGPQQFPQQYPQQYPQQAQYPQPPQYPAQPNTHPYTQQQPVQPIPYPTGYAPPYQNPPQVATYPPLAPLPTSQPYLQPGSSQPGVLSPLPGMGNPPQQPYSQNGYNQPQGYGQQPVAQQPIPQPPQQQPLYGNQPPQNGAPAGTIKIASFNIQVFGESKLRKPEAMRTIVDLVRRYDVVAIQELRATSDDIMPRFVAELNATGRRYDFVVGPRLGRTSSKEQYVFVFDTATIECDKAATYTAPNPAIKFTVRHWLQVSARAMLPRSRRLRLHSSISTPIPTKCRKNWPRLSM